MTDTARPPAALASADGPVRAPASPLSRLRRSPRAQRAAWALLAVVVAATLAVGAHRPSLAPRAARIAAIEADVKCPSCEDLSVAVSTAPTAIAVRHAIVQRVDAGETTAEVEQYLVGRYGPSILLRPPTSGGTGLVWELPLAAAAAGVAGLGVVFWRRRRVAAVALAAEDDELVRRALDAGAAAGPAAGDTPGTRGGERSRSAVDAAADDGAVRR